MNTNVDRNWTSQALSLAFLTYVAQAASIVIIPFMARVYAPEQYGLFAVYLAYLAVASVFSTWRYSMAIALPEDHRQAAIVVQACLAIIVAMTAVFSSFVVAAEVGGYSSKISEFAGVPLVIFYLFPLGIMLAGFMNVLSGWSLRTSNAVHVGLARIVQILVGAGCQLFLGVYWEASVVSLVLGQLAGQLVSIAVQATLSHRETGGYYEWYGISNAVRAVLLKYKSLPQTLFQTDLMNALGKKTLPVFISVLFGSKLAGLLSFATNVINAPLAAITASIWQVSHNRLSRQEENKRSRTLVLIHNLSSYLFSLPVVAIIVFRDQLPLILGDAWKDLPEVVPFLAAMIFMNSVSNTTSYFVVFRRFRQESMANILLTVLPIVSVVVGSMLLSGVETIALYCGLSALFYLVLNIYWGATTDNLGAFWKNLVLSILVNTTCLLLVRIIFDVSIWAGVASGAVYMSGYYFLIIRCRFRELKGV